jgi:mercuric ion binding protein
MNRSVAAILLGIGMLASGPAIAAEQTVTLAVQNMDCSSCPFIVKSTLEAVPGVARVAVSYRERTAVVTYDDNKVGLNALTTATTNAGYPSTPRG